MAGTTMHQFEESVRFLVEKFGLREFDQTTRIATLTAQVQNLTYDSGTKVEQKTLESRSYIKVAVQNTLTSSSWIFRPMDLLRIRTGLAGTNDFGSMTGETIARDLIDN